MLELPVLAFTAAIIATLMFGCLIGAVAVIWAMAGNEEGHE